MQTVISQNCFHKTVLLGPLSVAHVLTGRVSGVPDGLAGLGGSRRGLLQTIGSVRWHSRRLAPLDGTQGLQALQARATSSSMSVAALVLTVLLVASGELRITCLFVGPCFLYGNLFFCLVWTIERGTELLIATN